MIVTIEGESTDNVSTTGNGIVLQIPDGAEVLRAHFESSSSGPSGDLVANSSITSVYTAESGYHLWGGVATESNGNANGILKVWLSIPNNVTPGTYQIKAAVGGFVDSAWTPQNPKIDNSPITDFANISGNYISNTFDVSAGESDTTASSDVSVSISQENDHFLMDISSYNEEAQGDVAKYRVYVSKNSFTDTTGAQLLQINKDENSANFSSDIGSGLYYFELPPGAEYYNHFIITGLSNLETYYFAVTAIDLSNNESQPVVSTAIIEGCYISGVVKDGSGNGIPGVTIEVYNEAGDFIDMPMSIDENGNYMIFVPSGTGSIKLYFDPLRGSHNLYPGKWYDNKMDFSKADLINVENQGQEVDLKDVILAPNLEDTNGDGKVNVLDVICVINKILGM